ncbi:hypothetical protein EW026_g7336 [Hermanssonia centrifuga]|uniref:Uncharacterized protein n=1 Tax=Hermanssonia centrifuga TaxID=98765 RepID=A0A4S4K8C5_9APHY|nr:hypothetical protein EW026_g7336 [Hermanssonia centrifuga]
MFGAGAGLVGSWLAMTLYGLALAQTYTYSMECANDSLWTKASVLVVWVLNTAHLAFTSHAVYHILVRYP